MDKEFINSMLYWDLRHARDDWPRWSAWALQTPIKSIINRGSVIDVACGQGMECISLFKHRPDLNLIVGFDLSVHAIKKANINLEKAKIGYPDLDWTRVRFEVQDIFNMDSLYGTMSTFNYCISIQNMEHWKPEFHNIAAKHMLDFVKYGGKVFFTGVGKSWEMDENNYGVLILPDGKAVDAENDLHYTSWSEQDVYDLFIGQGASQVTFFPTRQGDRVIAEVTK